MSLRTLHGVTINLHIITVWTENDPTDVNSEYKYYIKKTHTLLTLRPICGVCVWRPVYSSLIIIQLVPIRTVNIGSNIQSRHKSRIQYKWISDDDGAVRSPPLTYRASTKHPFFSSHVGFNIGVLASIT